jgi:hypothetical protein
MINSAAFKYGYRQVLEGGAMDYDLYAGAIDDQWQYERGRHFGTAAVHIFGICPPLMDGRRVHPKALFLVDLAFAEGLVT